jgi:hypothetical protein
MRLLDAVAGYDEAITVATYHRTGVSEIALNLAEAEQRWLTVTRYNK